MTDKSKRPRDANQLAKFIVDVATVWEAAPTGKRGRQQTYSDTALQACRPIQVLFGMALGQTTGFVARLLKLAGSVPDFSTLSRRQKP